MSKMIQRKLLVVSKRLFQPEPFDTAVNDFDAVKSAQCIRTLLVNEPIGHGGI